MGKQKIIFKSFQIFFYVESLENNPDKMAEFETIPLVEIKSDMINLVETKECPVLQPLDTVTDTENISFEVNPSIDINLPPEGIPQAVAPRPTDLNKDFFILDMLSSLERAITSGKLPHMDQPLPPEYDAEVMSQISQKILKYKTIVELDRPTQEAKKQLSKVTEEFDCFVGAKWDTLENEEKLFFDEDEPLKRKQRK